MKAITDVMLLVVLVLLSPLIAIASLNTILEQANVAVSIPHNLWTYLSVYGLLVVFKGGDSAS